METVNNNIQPTWRGSLSHGWETMKRYFLPLFLVVIVLAVADIPLESISDSFDDEREPGEDNFIGPFGRMPVIYEIMVIAYWLLFVPVIEYGADLLFVQAARREAVNVKDIIIGFNDYVTIILANLLAGALVGIATIALIIPGIIVACRLAFVSYLVMDKGLDPIAAVEGSWKLTRGYGWKIFGLGIASIFIFIGGLLLLIVGTIPAVIWIKSSFASLYQAAIDETDETLYLPPQTA
ncbi:MAG: hypothetical protein WBA23_17985 [Tunicatimonas sp.]|uniref:hypothetical protein n=1 Tax=Tunicatimonas sp. TaxID=1940096 RepID=UPI003C752F22